MAASASFAADAVGTKAGELPPWAQEIDWQCTQFGIQMAADFN